MSLFSAGAKSVERWTIVFATRAKEYELHYDSRDAASADYAKLVESLRKDPVLTIEGTNDKAVALRCDNIIALELVPR